MKTRRFRFEVRNKVLILDGTADVIGEGSTKEAEAYLRGILASANKKHTPLIVKLEGDVLQVQVQAQSEDME